MNDYEQKCLDADKELAELLWPMEMQPIYDRDMKQTGTCGIWHPVRDDTTRPRWTQDNHSAFGLMVEYGCYPRYENTWHSVIINGKYYPIEGRTDAESIRFAIVQATINKLKAN